jgi:hypothetical protein
MKSYVVMGRLSGDSDQRPSANTPKSEVTGAEISRAAVPAARTDARQIECFRMQLPYRRLPPDQQAISNHTRK